MDRDANARRVLQARGLPRFLQGHHAEDHACGAGPGCDVYGVRVPEGQVGEERAERADGKQVRGIGDMMSWAYLITCKCNHIVASYIGFIATCKTES